MDYEIKDNSGFVLEVKQENRNGVPIGIVNGYLATWDEDDGKDQYIKGAFLEQLEEFQEKGKKRIQLTDTHKKVVGGFPTSMLHEDDKGLWAQAEINLETQAGREAYALAKTGDYSSFSTEYKAIEKHFENGIRKITKSKLFGGAILATPMNQHAVISEVKSKDENEVISKGINITELKNIRKSDLVKIFRSANLSRDAANHVASIVMTDNLVNDSGNPVAMITALRDQIKMIKEKL